MTTRLFAPLFLCLLGASLLTHAQGQPKAVSTGKPVLQNALPLADTFKMYAVEKRKLQRKAMPTVQLRNVQTRPATAAAGLKLPSAFTPSVSLGTERKQPVAFVLVPRYIRSGDGQVQELVSYDLDLQEGQAPQAKTAGNRVYAANSVLASGDWYKIGVSSQGLYRIDYAYIKNNLGVDLAGVPSAQIRLFGNGGEMLAEDNAIPRADDLSENAIAMYDGGDGVFNPGDYFLFYANGPHSVVFDSANQRFTHSFNIYSEQSVYFLNFQGNGRRIQSAPAAGTPTASVSTFDDFFFYEKDSVNPGKFGKNWWGDEFSDQPGRYLNRSYSMNFPNAIPGSLAKIRVRVGAISYSGNSTMNVFANGSVLQSVNLAAIGQSYSDPVLRVSDLSSEWPVSGDALTLNMNFSKGNSSAYAYLDFYEVNIRRNLVCTGYMPFAHMGSVGSGQIAEYVLQNADAATEVWDVTDPLAPVRVPGTLNGSELRVRRDASRLRRFVALNGSVYKVPAYIGKAANQNLHQFSAKDYLIITAPAFRAEAERLAAWHSTKRGYTSLIVTPDEIYNEFSSGTQDAVALRDFVKMYYDRSAAEQMPKYLLLFGDASFDFKNRVNGNTNFVPVYETWESINKTTGYCTDDFFGFLDDDENINNYSFTHTNTLDIGIGRITASSAAQARVVVNKILHYDSPASFGPWKNNMTFNADDGDNAIHLEDGEIMSGFVADSLPVYNNYKIYVDGYVQQSTPAGPRTPDANKAVVANLYNGTFLMNYNGHGGPLGWCEERIFSMDDVNYLTNLSKLPLFITATCDFAPFDNPTISSAGEILLHKADGGAIALMTTTQLVYADQNRIMNLNYMKEGFMPMDNGQYPTLGDAYRLSKNLRYVSSIDEFTASNFRKFALLGDPGLPLAFPKHRVYTDSINGVSVQQNTDTLKALGKYTISGHVADAQGNLLSGFNGVVYPTLFDKPKKLTTLQNDGDSPKRDYEVQNSAIYKGKATVKNGRFSFTFVVPKDINYAIDFGKISYYAQNETEDGNGYDKQVKVGGSATNAPVDLSGPLIKGFLNDEKFVNGGVTRSNSTLLLKLSDENGINYTGTSVGHDITATLDGNPQNTYVLNDFFEAAQDDYRSGTVRFPLNNLTEGQHYLQIKAWDVYNNSSEARLDFTVVNQTEGYLDRVYNYPNPFTTRTEFMFEHNMPNENLHVSIQIMNLSGRTVRQIRTVVNTPGTRVNGLEWDGRDESGDKLGRGVYLYKVSVRSSSGLHDSKLQKLILL